MNERIILKRAESGTTSDPKHPVIPALWAVLSPDFREELYEGTFKQCEQFLKNSCPSGACED